MSEKKYKTGLVLSGGGARGFAHLGVIEALNEEGIFPDVISGASAGALAGVLYADGYKPRQILKIMSLSSKLQYMKPTLPRSGLLQITGIAKILNDNLSARTFEELKIPLFVSATDLTNGKAVYFSKGELINRVIASASIPVLFNPVVIDNIHYVDGGVLDNLPIRPIEDKCNLIIGSFVNPVGHEEELNSLIQIAERTFSINMFKEIYDKSSKFDIFVAPDKLIKFKILEPEKGPELFEVGYNAMKTKLKEPDIQKCIALKLGR